VEEIYQVLTSEIVTGRLRPGEYLSEGTLLERFHASRTPIREALIHVYKEGLLQKGPFKGYVVSQMSLENVRELYQIRRLLEPGAARLAAKNLRSENDCERLEEICDRMQQCFTKVTKFQDTLHLSELDGEFHRSIAESSKNKQLAKFISEVLILFRRVHYASYQNRGWDSETLLEHRAILEAIKIRDERASEQLMLKHLGLSLKRIVKELSMDPLGDEELF
jgi:DNA-binding GntR family transcriptional regulator